MTSTRTGPETRTGPRLSSGRRGAASARLGGGLGLVAAGAGGLLLGAALGVTAVARRSKPLHTLGAVTEATLSVTQPAGLGVPLLDSEHEQRVLVRLSRAVSLRPHGWDVMGLAVRVPQGAADHEDGDLLFSTTGTGSWTRFLLQPRPAWGTGDSTTLLPLAWHAGTATLRLHARSITEYDLSVWPHPDAPRDEGPWRPIGRLVLDEVPAKDAPLRFRPLSPPAGLAVPGWVRAVREPAYATARRLVRP